MHGTLAFVPSQVPSQAASNLDRAIRARHLTNRQVAESIGTTELEVWRWRHAKHAPSARYRAALAQLLFDGDMHALDASDPEDARVT